MKEQIQAFVKESFVEAQNVTVNEPSQISEGWETEIYSFDVAYKMAGDRRHEELILRLFPGDGAEEQAAKEFRAMSVLHQAGYPVPLVLYQGGADSQFGKPYIVMERVVGKTLWSFMFRSETDHKEALLEQFCGLFVQLHAFDWWTVAGEIFLTAGDDPYHFVDRWLKRAEDYSLRFGLSSFNANIEWLQARRDKVPCNRPALVHQDFHPNNILMREDGSAVVIDWSGFEIADFRYDLAWTMLLVGSYEDRVWRDRILKIYERLSGRPVEQTMFFDVAACLSRLANIVVALRGSAGELGMNPDAVALISQQMPAHKRVYDLLLERTGIPIAEVEQLFRQHVK